MLAYAACALVAFTCLTVLVVHRAQRQFPVYREQVVAQALKPSYSMDFESTNISDLTGFLADRFAPADYKLPASLSTAKPVGCAIISFHGKPTTMLCFRSGKPLGPGEVADVWLFVAKQGDILNPPLSSSRTLTQMDKMATATWAQDGDVYTIGVLGDQSVLQKYL
jgi:hypothetical protein